MGFGKRSLAPDHDLSDWDSTSALRRGEKTAMTLPITVLPECASKNYKAQYIDGESVRVKAEPLELYRLQPEDASMM